MSSAWLCYVVLDRKRDREWKSSDIVGAEGEEGQVARAEKEVSSEMSHSRKVTLARLESRFDSVVRLRMNRGMRGCLMAERDRVPATDSRRKLDLAREELQLGRGTDARVSSRCSVLGMAVWKRTGKEDSEEDYKETRVSRIIDSLSLRDSTRSDPPCCVMPRRCLNSGVLTNLASSFCLHRSSIAPLPSPPGFCPSITAISRA